jgi:pimeloyl-ACP methyl ester carboxylesterase
MRPIEPSPLWFGAEDRPLFGWYHPSRVGAARAGIVLCSPFGHEAMSTHRGHRRLAERYAEAGFAVLRFDYDGTGNSAGHGHDPERLGAWMGSIRQACATLLRLSGAPRTILLGTRFGALMALKAAVENPVDALILIAPPASGRALVREMQALHALKQTYLTHPPAEPEGAVVGFPLDATARAALSGIDLKKFEEAPAQKALIVVRDDLPSGEEKLAARLREVGTDTVVLSVPGYAAFVQDDPIKSIFPEGIAAATLAWLEELCPVVSTTETARSERQAPIRVLGESASRPTSNESTLTELEFGRVASPDREIREEAVHFAGLFGVLTSPATRDGSSRPAIALLNIGANHHVGSNRLYVSMARAWARRGFHVLRLDFPGIGDSPAAAGRRENDVYSSHLIRDTKAAIDFLEASGAENIVLVGLCSGAYAAYHSAVADPRVSDLVLINLLTFHWTEGDTLEVRSRRSAKSTRFYKRAAMRPRTWKRLVTGQVNLRRIATELARRVRRRLRREAESLVAKVSGGAAGTDIEQGFRHLEARGTSCLAIYGSNDSGIDVLEEQLGAEARALRGSSAFRMVILEGPDHTFTPLWTQAHLIELIGDHLVERLRSRTGSKVSQPPVSAVR